MSKDLFEAASSLLNDRYSPPVHTVAAALRTKKGRIICALNIDHFSGFVCAETAALTIAINEGEYEFDDIVAVRKDEGEPAIANMCGKCRQIFYDYAPTINIVTSNGVMNIDEVLPGAFTRQREKIQAALSKDEL